MRKALILIVGVFVVFPIADTFHLLVPEHLERIGLYGTKSKINWIVYDCMQLFARAYCFAALSVAISYVRGIATLPKAARWIQRICWIYAYIAILQSFEVIIGVSGRGRWEQVVIWGPYAIGAVIGILHDFLEMKKRERNKPGFKFGKKTRGQ